MTQIPAGTLVRITKNDHHAFALGQIVERYLAPSDDESSIGFKPVAAADNTYQYVGLDEFEVVDDDSDAVLTRPLVHFSDAKAGRNRELARAYAAEAVSKVLKPEDNAILKQAAAGRSVDAYALNRAVTAAMRSSVTRKGQSTARRQQAEHFAHLGHIVQAVLENHADNLPAYQNGERSRVIGKTNDVNRRLNEELRQKDGLLAEAQTAIAHAKVEVDNVTEQLRIQRAGVEAAEAAERTLRVNLTRTVAEANEFEAGLAYAKSLLDGASAAMVDAFIEGFRVGSED